MPLNFHSLTLIKLKWRFRYIGKHMMVKKNKRRKNERTGLMSLDGFLTSLFSNKLHMSERWSIALKRYGLFNGYDWIGYKWFEIDCHIWHWFHRKPPIVLIDVAKNIPCIQKQIRAVMGHSLHQIRNEGCYAVIEQNLWRKNGGFQNGMVLGSKSSQTHSFWCELL